MKNLKREDIKPCFFCGKGVTKNGKHLTFFKIIAEYHLLDVLAIQLN